MTDPRIDALVQAAATARPQAIAILDHDWTSDAASPAGRGRALSWAEFDAAVDEAAALIAASGVVAGDRVLIVAENCAALAAFIFGASRAGAIAVPVNARMSAPELARIAAHAAPHLTVWTVDASPEAEALAGAAGAQAAQGLFGRIAWRVSGANDSEPSAGPDVAVLLYTTGTTGAPKGVMLTHANLRFAGNASARLRGMQAGDVIYGALPLTHVFGLASMLVAGASVGAAVRLAPRFRADRLLEALRSGVNILPAVPQMHALLMQHTESLGEERLDSPSLRYVSSGAAPLDPAWKRKAEAFYGLPLQNGYGMTETTAGVTATQNPIGLPDTSVGKPLPGVEVRLDESVGNEAGVGEVQTRGPHVMAGYFRNPSETARAMTDDGFLRTGDLGRFDAQGNLHIVGRSKELIIRSGFNVYPPEVEAAFNDHPDVIQCAVIGRTTADGNEEVLAFVQCADPERLDVAALAAFAAERLTSYKRPSRIIATRQLPAASTGKILKHRLRDTFARELGEA